MGPITQYMPIKVDYITDSPINGGTNGVTIKWSTLGTLGEHFSWGLCNPLSGSGTTVMNQAGTFDSPLALPLCSFSILAVDANLHNAVEIKIPPNTDFNGMSLQFFLLADNTVTSKTKVPLSVSSPPAQLTIHVYDAKAPAVGCKLNHLQFTGSFYFRPEG
ncbi:hypothetical protein [Trinickia sp. Y13]|uniref:hypothetical protein n=1 Tax=Trinickia sp. Y13 TaxID=2917807 RepID=UPI002405A76B|nr:hypothetical protein [Trinickia sp. Y13]MDG0022863.1 hypothetical protein [Trinickia sp. Y13]